MKCWNLGRVYRHTLNAILVILLLWMLVFNLLQLFVYRRLKRPRFPKDPCDTIISVVVAEMLRDVGAIPERIAWEPWLTPPRAEWRSGSPAWAPDRALDPIHPGRTLGGADPLYMSRLHWSQDTCVHRPAPGRWALVRQGFAALGGSPCRCLGILDNLSGI